MGTFTTTTRDVPLTVSRLDSPSEPLHAVVVLQEAWGVNKHIESILERLAAAGYLAVAPHLYHRGAQTSFTGFPSPKDALMALDSTGIGHDVRAAVDYCRSEGADRVGSLGFCMGGTASLWCAAGPLVDSAVTYYGGGVAGARGGGSAAGRHRTCSATAGPVARSLRRPRSEYPAGERRAIARNRVRSRPGVPLCRRRPRVQQRHFDQPLRPGFCCPRLDPHYGVLHRNLMIANVSQGTRLTTVPVISS